MIDHVSFEVSDLERAGRFYDAVFFTLGARRTFAGQDAIAYGVTGRTFWLRARPSPGSGNGHVALRANGKAAVDAAHAAGMGAGGIDAGPPGPRPQNGSRCYAAYLRDPDGLRVEVVAGGQG